MAKDTSLRQKTIKELEKMISQKRDKIAKLRLERNTNRLKNVHQLKSERHHLSRMLTILSEKRLMGKNL